MDIQIYREKRYEALAGSVINIINTTKKRRALKEQEESWANGVQ